MAGCVSLRSPELVWDVLARGRYDFTYDLMPVSARNMSWAKRLNRFKSGTNVYSAASQLLIGYLYTYYNSVPEQARFFTTINLAVAAEEREFCDRWSHHGRDMAFVPEAVIHHFHTLSLSSFWRQHFDYGRGAYQFRQARACRDASPIRFEPASFYLNMLRFPFGRRRGVGALSVMMLLVVSQVANAAGFFRERARDR